MSSDGSAMRDLKNIPRSLSPSNVRFRNGTRAKTTTCSTLGDHGHYMRLFWSWKDINYQCRFFHISLFARKKVRSGFEHFRWQRLVRYWRNAKTEEGIEKAIDGFGSFSSQARHHSSANAWSLRRIILIDEMTCLISHCRQSWPCLFFPWRPSEYERVCVTTRAWMACIKRTMSKQQFFSCSDMSLTVTEESKGTLDYSTTLASCIAKTGT